MSAAIARLEIIMRTPPALKHALFATAVVGSVLVGTGCHKSPEPPVVMDKGGGTAPPSVPSAPADDAAPAPAASATEPSNALPIPTASVEAVVNPSKFPIYRGPTGSVEGTVLVRGPEAPDVPTDVRNCPAALDTYGKLFRAGAAREDGLRPLADAVVAITGYTGFYLPEKEDVQKVTIHTNCAYDARTIAVTFGQRIDVSNDTRLPFAPYLDDTIHAAIMVAPPLGAGEPAKLYPPRTGFFRLRDRMEPFVRGDVYVLRQPLHAVSDSSGHFRIDDVPTGLSLQVGARLAELGEPGNQATANVTARPTVIEHVELVLTYTPAPVPAHSGKPLPEVH